MKLIPPPTPKFNNSAGRLLVLLGLFKQNDQISYFDAVAGLYVTENGAPGTTEEFKAKAFLDFMSHLGATFDEFINDLDKSSLINDGSRQILKGGLSQLIKCIYTIAPQGTVRKPKSEEVALLEMAASLLASDPEADEDDIDYVNESIDDLWEILKNPDLTLGEPVKHALLEVIRLSRNAIDYYSINGSQGFRKAFKNMLAELMELYLHEANVVSQPWWKSVLQHLKNVDNVVGKLLKYRPLLEGGAKLFMEDHSSTPVP